MTAQTPHLLGPSDGDDHWMLGILFSIKATAEQTGGTLTAFEFLAPPGFAPPPHVHEREDELFYVREGIVTFMLGGLEETYGPGGFVWAPRGLAHGFRVSEDGPATVFQTATPAGFEHFVAALGEPAPEHTIPPPPDGPPDLARVVQIGAEFGITMLPPDTEL